jgi:hypothetical protein
MFHLHIGHLSRINLSMIESIFNWKSLDILKTLNKEYKFGILTPKGLREPKRPFLILGRLPYVPKVVGVFETA